MSPAGDETVHHLCIDARTSVDPAQERLTIAFFSAPLDSTLNYEKRQVWLGMCQVAREQDANLLYLLPMGPF